MRRSHALIGMVLSAALGCAGCAAFSKNLTKVDDTITDVADATAETLACMANLTKMAEMLGNRLSPSAAAAVCTAITVQKNIPARAPATTPDIM
jgi:hypothetical protein